MKVVRLEAVCNAAIRIIQRLSVAPRRPVAGKCPFIQAQSHRGRIGAGLIDNQPSGRREILGPFIPRIVFTGLQAPPISRGLDTAGFDRYGVAVETGACFGQP